MASTFRLTDRERASLVAICDGFHPALTVESGDDPLLFGASASDLGVPAAAEEAIGMLAAPDQRELCRLLALLDFAPVARLVGGPMRGVTQMTADERGRMLWSMATSRIPQLRSGFQALKRLSGFLYFTNTDETGQNRIWPSVGYRPSPKAAATDQRLEITGIGTETKLDADVCIIGSGAGGGVAAGLLARRGFRIVVLEAGPADQAGDFQQQELEGTRRLYLDSGQTSTRDVAVGMLAGACVGGGTTVNWQTSLRTPDSVRDEWSDASGSSLFTSDRYTRALDDVMKRIGASTDESIVNANNATIARGCKALGYEHHQLARNSVGCDVEQCGYCVYGCRRGSKRSTATTYLRDAQLHGDTTIIANCKADRVTIAGGRAIGVLATATRSDGSQVRVTVRAPRVVVAAGGLQSPALLLRSGLTLPQLGRNLFLHPTTATIGLYADLVESWRGAPQTMISEQFTALDGQFGFRLEAAPVHPGLIAYAVPWANARQFRRLAQRYAHGSAMIVLTRDSEGGQVRVRRDGSTTYHYVPSARQSAILARGMAEAARVHLAAGAEEVLSLHTEPMSFRRTATTTRQEIDAFCERIVAAPVGRNRSGVFSAHQMGTCRMGRDARSAVCDERGEVFGVKGLYVADASLFPLSSGVNPMVTVMALAQSVVDEIE
jgi:choline dehydrogenase-like flavoprotein